MAADVFIQLSMEESFGKVAEEAMAYGTPVVAFDLQPIPNLSRKNEAHWFPVGISVLPKTVCIFRRKTPCPFLLPFYKRFLKR